MDYQQELDSIYNANSSLDTVIENEVEPEGEEDLLEFQSTITVFDSETQELNLTPMHLNQPNQLQMTIDRHKQNHPNHSHRFWWKRTIQSINKGHSHKKSYSKKSLFTMFPKKLHIEHSNANFI